MTDQKTPLKTKAKTLAQWCIDYREIPSGTPDYLIKEWTKELVLLSDVEPLELEIQQLKDKLDEEYKTRCKIENALIEKQEQIETAKQILKEIEEKHPVPYRVCKFNRVKEVFGEKTET